MRLSKGSRQRQEAACVADEIRRYVARRNGRLQCSAGKVGVNQVEIHYVPKTLRAETTISISGVINREFTFFAPSQRHLPHV